MVFMRSKMGIDNSEGRLRRFWVIVVWVYVVWVYVLKMMMKALMVIILMLV